jgi:altronate dehydratase
MSSAPAPLDLHAVARLPAPGDNVAIAIRRLEAGTPVLINGKVCPLSHTVLEGHRFAVRPIAPGEEVLSWELPFGVALVPIAPGDYVCNRTMIDALVVRQTGASLPTEPNFRDQLEPYVLDESTIRPGPAVVPATDTRTFAGYTRPGGRGIGTRNFVVILGTTSRTASYARQLAARLQPLAKVHPGIDGIVAIAHTEGDGPGEPNNAQEILRTMAGFIVHPNVAAILAVDHGVEPVNNARLRTFMHDGGYPLGDVLHAFLTLSGGLAAGLAEGERLVRSWLPAANALPRTPQPLSGLRIALQCGGSDAFSGISGNPLAGALVHEVVRHGGSGNLCETDELMGAESYILRNVRDVSLARTFLDKLASFRARLSWHGITAESNPSGGNKFRGLYNIALKSLGAAHKKDPRTRLDYVIDYAQPMTAPGFYFMNSPGNDLEGIAGQIGAGCNLLIFVTGNGSITNFPFVPTLKITTTTKRHQLLIHEMDINAGRYLDGEKMDALVAENFDLLLATASGRRTQGEHAGHSQTSFWRNWRQTDTSQLEKLKARSVPNGIPLRSSATLATRHSPLATDRIALVLPTSLCAAQIARLAADRLNEKQLGRDQGITRFVGLTHTEGCGFGGETMHQLLHRTYRGYITHPNVAAALLLEHGCEKVPNDMMRRQLELNHVPLDRFGWASVQLDGGIEKAIGRIESWFTEKFASLPPAAPVEAKNSTPPLTLGLISAAPASTSTATAFAAVANEVLRAGGSVLLPESDPLLANPAFLQSVLGEAASEGRDERPARPGQPQTISSAPESGLIAESQVRPDGQGRPSLPSIPALRASLAYGEPLVHPGLHLVATESDHWTENLTGLGASGTHLFLTLVADHARPGHPMLPVLQVAEPSQRGRLPADDIDFFLSGEVNSDTSTLLAAVRATALSRQAPRSSAQGYTDFQLTRGLLGVST